MDKQELILKISVTISILMAVIGCTLAAVLNQQDRIFLALFGIAQEVLILLWL